MCTIQRNLSKRYKQISKGEFDSQENRKLRPGEVVDERKVRKWREKKKRMPRLQPYYSTTNALIFFFTFTFVLFLFLARYFFYLVSHKLLLRYAYLSNKHRTKSEIKINIIFFAIMISSFDSACSPRLLFSTIFTFIFFDYLALDEPEAGKNFAFYLYLIF